MGESATFDNPLMPNARLREIYLAMMRLREVEQSLRVQDRSGVLGREACIVASSIGLSAGDLLSDTYKGRAMSFLRGQALHRALHPDTPSRKRGVFAHCSAAVVLPPIASPGERVWAAIGAAAATQAKYGLGGAERNVVVVSLRDKEIPAALLRKALQYAGEQVLPILFITTRGGAQRKSYALSELATRSGVPGIAVDAEDAVAIYRVTEESVGRARSGAGPALIDCTPFAPGGRSPSVARQTKGPLAAIERYILERNVVTPEWISRHTRDFARHLRQPVH